MKKLILLALLAVIMAGCYGVQKNQDGSIILDDYWKERSIDNPYRQVIDYCEYVCWGERMAHKGNCRFCAQRDSIKWEKRKAEIVELLKNR